VAIPYKPFPFSNRGLQVYGVIYRPVLTLQLINKHTSSKRIEAVIDTGCDACLFEAPIGESIGLKIKKGTEGPLSGVISNVPPAKVYYHKIKLLIGTDLIEITAGFSWDISQNLLGQIGFLDHFIVTFDPVPNPPSFSIQRVQLN